MDRYSKSYQGGKYATGIVFYLFYYLWRHAGEPRGVHLILMCFWGTAYAVYACTWVGLHVSYISQAFLKI